MSEYRIIFEYKDKERTKVLNATDVEGAKNLFFSKIKDGAKQAIKIKDVRPVEPVTKEYIFNNEIAATFLQWYLEQADADEYDFNCTMEGKAADDETKNEMQAMHDFVKSNYLTNIKIVITGDRK